MPRINLLPWREELRKRRQRDFGVLAGLSVLAMAVVVLSVHAYFSGRIEFQESRNAYLQRQIALLDERIREIEELDQEKSRLLARMEIIQQLQASRPEIVHLFDELVETLPDGVYLTRLAQKGRSLNLEGVAQSNARVSSLMRNMDDSAWMENPALVEIKARSKSPDVPIRLSQFSMRIQQTDQLATDVQAEEGS